VIILPVSLIRYTISMLDFLYWCHNKISDMSQNRDDIKQKIRPILQKYGIARAGIFGSAARGESTARDIDLLVKIDRKISLLEFIAIQQELEDVLGVKVDLVEYSAIKPALRDEILEDEVPVI